MKMKQTILYIINTILTLVVILFTQSGCSHEYPTPKDEYVALELVGLAESVEINTRAGLDPSLTAIHNATIIVFHATEDKVLQRRTINYASPANERVYLKRGETYRVFVIANIDDDNCPGEYTAATYFEDVAKIADLNSKYFLSTTELGMKPVSVPMISGTTATPLEEVTIPNPLTLTPDNTTIVTLKLRSLYTKVTVNLYNLVNESGTNLSGVEILSYYSNNLPIGSYIVERTTTDIYTNDYPQSLDPKALGYQRSSLGDIRIPTENRVKVGDRWYDRHSFDVYCLENRRGTVSDLNSGNVYDRKSKAPKFSFEISFQGNVGDRDVLQTYVVIGKGDDGTNPVYNDFNLDRNCIYLVNIYVNGVGGVDADSRRMYLNVVVCGNIESPEDGDGYEF